MNEFLRPRIVNVLNRNLAFALRGSLNLGESLSELRTDKDAFIDEEPKVLIWEKTHQLIDLKES